MSYNPNNQPPIAFRPGAPQQPLYTSNFTSGFNFGPGPVLPTNVNVSSFGMGPMNPNFMPPGPQQGIMPPAMNLNQLPANFGDQGGNQGGNNIRAQSSRTFYMSGASQNMANKHIKHLRDVMPFVEREFTGTPYKALIQNNSELPVSSPLHDLSIDIEIDLTISNQKFPIRIKLLKEFSKDAPIVYVKNIFEHPLINSNTREIDYSSYYPWQKNNSKLIELVKATEQCFNKSNPFLSSEDKKVEQVIDMFNSTAVLEPFEKINLTNLYNSLSKTEKEAVTSGDQLKIAELLKSQKEYIEFQKLNTILVKLITSLNETVKKEVVEMESTYQGMKNAQVQAEASSDALMKTFESTGFLAEKFEKRNIINFMVQSAEENEKQMSSANLAERIRSSNDKNSLEKVLNDFVRAKSEFYKKRLTKNKLRGVQGSTTSVLTE